MVEYIIIFDLDGVIINTERSTFDFYKNELSKHKIFLKEGDFQLKLGRKSVDFFKDLAKTYKSLEKINTEELIQRKRTVFMDNIPKYVDLVCGTHKVLSLLKEAGFRMVVASQNERAMIDKVLKYFNLGHFFELSLSLQDIKKKKPDPEIYLKCFDVLNASNERVVVIEDSPDGIMSAKNAGIKVIAIDTSKRKDLIKDGDYVIDSLIDLTPEFVMKIFSNMLI